MTGSMVRSCCCLLHIHSSHFLQLLFMIFFLWVFSCFLDKYGMKRTTYLLPCRPPKTRLGSSSVKNWLNKLQFSWHAARKRTDDIAYITDDDRVSFSCRLSESSRRLSIIIQVQYSTKFRIIYSCQDLLHEVYELNNIWKIWDEKKIWEIFDLENFSLLVR